MPALPGREYLVSRIEITLPPRESAERLTIEINRIAQYGWTLVSAPTQGTAISINVWTMTFERAREWPTKP
jgi:hypothetical protein